MKNNIKYIIIIIYCFIINTNYTMQKDSNNNVYHFDFVYKYQSNIFDNSPFVKYLEEHLEEACKYAKEGYEQKEQIAQIICESLKEGAKARYKFEKEINQDIIEVCKKVYEERKEIARKIYESFEEVYKLLNEGAKARYTFEEEINQSGEKCIKFLAKEILENCKKTFEDVCTKREQMTQKIQKTVKVMLEDVKNTIKCLTKNIKPIQINSVGIVEMKEKSIQAYKNILADKIESELFLTKNKNILILVAAIAIAATVMRFCYYKYLKSNNNDDKQ